MNITITATLSEDQIEILSNMKWYQPTISETEINEAWMPVIISTKENPQSRADFIAEQYLGLITWDAKNEFLRFAKIQKEVQEKQEEEWIETLINTSISVSTWEA